MSNSVKKVKVVKSTKNVTPVIDERFVFVRENGSSKIHDEKFKTKATTFARDAFKRFCKNKSSVVGAIIIGILLLGSIIVPLVSPYQTSVDQSWQALLEPKICSNNGGFWDGTKTYVDAVYDPVNKLPVAQIREEGKVNPEAVVDVWDIKQVYISAYSPYASGGYCAFTSDDALREGEDPESKLLRTYNKNVPFKFDGNYAYTMKVNFGNEDNIDNHMLCEKYRFRASIDGAKNYVTLVDWANLKEEVNLDLTALLKAQGIDNADKLVVTIEGLPKVGKDEQGNYKTCNFLVSSINFTTTNPDATVVTTLSSLCQDGNRLCIGDLKQVCWSSNGKRIAYKVIGYTCTFRYDSYEHVFGKKDIVVGQSLFDEYVAKGWCTFNKETLEFHVLDADKCPVIQIYGRKSSTEYNCQVYYYRYKGLSSYPSYWLGSTPEGHDLFTKVLGCLKTSLLVAIIASAICLAIGLIWGSISGYFGGTVDLVMERITDIISGIPWVVLMTLIILLMGNSIVTFAFALVMTGWIGTAGTTRTQFYRFRDREYVLASRTLGASDARLIFKHILPNALGTIVTASVLMIPACIFSEASISYLGLGLKGVDSFGVLFSRYQQYLSQEPMLVVFPAIIISLLMISFNLFGNGLRDALNPTLKGGEQ